MRTTTAYQDYTVSVPVEESSYGSGCTREQAIGIAARLETMLAREFSGIQIRTWRDGTGSGRTTGPDQDVIDEINDWVSRNWTAAL
jgi:protein gp37